MSKSDTRGENPNATIQLSALDAAELVTFDSQPPSGEPGPPSRLAPPPLPPPPVIAAPPRAAAGGSKTFAYVAIFVVLLAGAIGAGLAVGSYARSRRAATAPPSAVPAPTVALTAPSADPASAAAAAPTASAAPKAFVMPTVEVSAPAH
jgi:hypothetical protein